jgi:hypothetical protein
MVSTSKRNREIAYGFIGRPKSYNSARRIFKCMERGVSIMDIGTLAYMVQNNNVAVSLCLEKDDPDTVAQNLKDHYIQMIPVAMPGFLQDVLLSVLEDDIDWKALVQEVWERHN